jgi:hypothetical protein
MVKYIEENFATLICETNENSPLNKEEARVKIHIDFALGLNTGDILSFPQTTYPKYKLPNWAIEIDDPNFELSDYCICIKQKIFLQDNKLVIYGYYC